MKHKHDNMHTQNSGHSRAQSLLLRGEMIGAAIAAPAAAYCLLNDASISRLFGDAIE